MTPITSKMDLCSLWSVGTLARRGGVRRLIRRFMGDLRTLSNEIVCRAPCPVASVCFWDDDQGRCDHEGFQQFRR